MKTRATSFLLAALAAVNLVLPVLADELPTATQAKDAEIETAAQTQAETESQVEAEVLRDAIVLDGEPARSVEFEMLDGVCYVTVSSFASMMDPEAVAEEKDGVVTVSAAAVAEVEPLSGAAGAESLANVVTDELSLLAAAGASYCAANGRYLYTQDPLIQLNGRVAAPVRLLARVYNLDVAYNTENNLVVLNHREGAQPYLTDGSQAYDGDTLYWLSHIIYAESGNQPLEGQIAVGNVVMNRVRNPRFPNSVYSVLFQKNQFSPASSGSIYREPSWDSTLAAMLVMDGAQVTDALFFNTTWIRAPKGRTYVATIGDHVFYK